MPPGVLTVSKAAIDNVDTMAKRKPKWQGDSGGASRTPPATVHAARQLRADAVLETSPLGILAVDRAGLIVWTNGRVEQMFGYAPGQLVGQRVETLLPTRLRVLHEQHRDEFFGDPRVRPMGLGLDLAARRKDGSEFPVEISLSFTASRGERLIALAFITDITRRKEADRRLTTEFAITRLLAESPTLDALASRLLEIIGKSLGWDFAEWWRVDGDSLGWDGSWSPMALNTSEFEAVSRGMCLQPGVSLPGRVWSDGRAAWTKDVARDVGFLRAPIADALGLRSACAFPIRSGERTSAVVVLFSRSPRTADDELLQTLTDIGSRIAEQFELRRMEQELARQRDVLYQSEKLAALGRLVAGVAHEMNNPLSVISSRIELMLADAVGLPIPAQHLEDLKVVHRNVLRVAGVAQALRSFARQSTGERRPVNLNTVVEETLLLAGKPLSQDNIQITRALDPDLPCILGNANALQQVLLNLLTNAREAMSGGGDIRIETGSVPERPARLRLVVSDTGPGISPADLPHLFEPFYTTKPAGTGLGLAVSYGIVQDHEGTIEARSAHGQGATFTLTFPALERT